MREAKTDEARAAAKAEFAAVKIPVPSIAKVADHIDYIRKVAGVDYIGLGGDFDGNDAWPEGLSDVSMYPNLFAELIRRGWSDADLMKLAGGNVLRVLEANERVAKKLQYGCTWVNTHFMLVNEMPHGGLKQSGYGKDMSAYALEDYTVVRHVMVKHG